MNEQVNATRDRKFLFTYRYEGSEYGLDVIASSPAEAKARVQQMALARYDGEIFATVKVPGLLAKIIMALVGR